LRELTSEPETGRAPGRPWICSLPFCWIAAWVWAVSLVDEGSLDLGGAGPDAYDFVDTPMIVIGSGALAVVSGLLLFGVSRWRDHRWVRRRVSP
jgi:hypothetical protein